MAFPLPSLSSDLKVPNRTQKRCFFLSPSEMKWDRHYPVNVQNTVEALVSGHHRDAKKVSIIGAGRLRECENTEFVLELRKTGFCEGGRK